MKKAFFLSFLLSGCSYFAVYHNEVTVPVNRVTSEGIGEQIGTITFADSRHDGMIIKCDLSGLKEGEHGFHLHEKPSCEPGMKDGKVIAAGAAGPHWDPHKTGAHKGPFGGGHEGDLPKLLVDGDGNAVISIIAGYLTVADVKGRSIMIHEGGDNYSDSPAPLGGGGARIACGVIP
jgi:Cu-Zn family superoxide dismutase